MNDVRFSSILLQSHNEKAWIWCRIGFKLSGVRRVVQRWGFIQNEINYWRVELCLQLCFCNGQQSEFGLLKYMIRERGGGGEAEGHGEVALLNYKIFMVLNIL